MSEPAVVFAWATFVLWAVPGLWHLFGPLPRPPLLAAELASWAVCMGGVLIAPTTWPQACIYLFTCIFLFLSGAQFAYCRQKGM